MNQVITAISSGVELDTHDERIAEKVKALGPQWKIVDATSFGFVTDGEIPFGPNSHVIRPVLTVITTMIAERIRNR